jgi:thioredoxin reductase (NADPH)
VLHAIAVAIEKRGLVSVEVVDIYENKDLAQEYGAMSVPKTFVDDVLISSSLQPEEYLVESIIKGKAVEYVMPAGREELRDYDLVIIGAGPAGLTAAIYAERSGLKSIIFEGSIVGGQIAITPVVENYPGFTRIAGKTLVELMAKQAMDYSSLLQGVEVKDIKPKGAGFEVKTTRGDYSARGLVIATGATHRKLGVPGEDYFSGRGVSYCSTCDGYIFKDGLDVLVVGGGNTALTDALYLDSIGAHVTIVHRRESFRSEAHLQEKVFKLNIPVLWNTVVKEILGDRVVEKARVEDLKSGKTRDMKVDGVFVSIGYDPNAGIAKKMGLELTDEGYIKADTGQRTNIPRVYAAGDVTGGVKQIVVATGQGSVAAISAFEDLGKTS